MNQILETFVESYAEKAGLRKPDDRNYCSQCIHLKTVPHWETLPGGRQYVDYITTKCEITGERKEHFEVGCTEHFETGKEEGE